MIRKAFALNFERITGFGPYQSGGADPGGTLERFFSGLLGFLTVLGGIAFLIYFSLGAITWITSKGDKQQVEKAQGYMSNAFIGIVVLILAWAITGVVGALVGVDFLNLSGLIGTITP